MLTRTFILIIFLLLSICSPGRSADWGNSNNFFIKKKLNDEWWLVSRSLFVSRNNMSDLFFGTADLGLAYKLTDWFELSGAYRVAMLRDSDDWEYEHRPLINFLSKTTYHDYFLSHRLRVEFRNFQDMREDDVRLRNEFRIVAPYAFTKWNLKSFIEEEFFYSSNQNQINENWLTTGVRYRMNQYLTIKTGYRWQNRKSGDEWINRHIFVTGLLFTF